MKKLLFCYPNVSFSQTAKIEFNYQSKALLKNFFFLHQFSPPNFRLSTYLVSLAILKSQPSIYQKTSLPIAKR